MANGEYDKYLRLIAACKHDKVAFCRYILDFEPHDGQIEWLQKNVKPEGALTTGNRWGKSFIAAADLIHRCVYRDGWDDAIEAAMAKKHDNYHGINVSYSADQSKIVWFKAQSMLQSRLAEPLVKDVKMTPFPTIIFQNDATLEARTTARDGIYLLGHDYDVANWDEAAFDKKYKLIRDNVLRMRLVDRDGKLIHTSTGNGRNDYGQYFLDGLAGKDKHLYCQTGSTFQNTNIKLSAVERNMERLTEKMRQQNIEGAIVDGGGTVFPIEDLTAAHDESLDEFVRMEVDDEELARHVWLAPQKWASGADKPWHQTYPSHHYLHCWDLADKKDYMVGLTYDVTTKPAATLVEFERFNKQGWAYNKDRIRLRHKKYPNSRTRLDITGIGDVVVDDLKDIRATGIWFTNKIKDEMITALQLALAQRNVRWPLIQVFQDEHSFYERDDDDLSTDCVMANIMAAWYIRGETRGTGAAFFFGKNS